MTDDAGYMMLFLEDAVQQLITADKLKAELGMLWCQDIKADPWSSGKLPAGDWNEATATYKTDPKAHVMFQINRKERTITIIDIMLP